MSDFHRHLRVVYMLPRADANDHREFFPIGRSI